MVLLENLDYENLMGISLVVTMTVANISNIDTTINKYYRNDYKRYDYIDFSKENNFEKELGFLINFLELKFNTKIANYWIPAKDILYKVYLFVSFENQEKLESCMRNCFI